MRSLVRLGTPGLAYSILARTLRLHTHYKQASYFFLTNFRPKEMAFLSQAGYDANHHVPRGPS